MTKAQDIFRSALQLITNDDANATPDAAQFSDALFSLNNLLSELSAAEILLLYAPVQCSFTAPDNTLTFTIGPTGDVETDRPTRIRDMFVRYGNIDSPIEQINRTDFEAIVLKDISGVFPTVCWYEPTMDDGTVYLWPGLIAGQTVYFTADQVLEQFTSFTQDVDLPPEYVRFLIYNLAVDIAPMYGSDASATVQRIAASSKRNIKRLNASAKTMKGDTWLLASKTPRRGSILRGY